MLARQTTSTPRFYLSIWLAYGALVIGCPPRLAANPVDANRVDANSPTDPPAHSKPPIRFNESVRPLLAEHCAACHGGVKRAAGVSVIYRQALLEGHDGSTPVVIAGDPDASELMRRVRADDAERMPPAEHGPRLTDEEIATLAQWISEGAVWEQPWGLIPPRVTSLPKVSDVSWCRTRLDHYVLSTLDTKALQPASEASRPEWLRRVSFDLTGLPPTIAEIDQFLADEHPQAYEHVVDRLLDAPQFGERWASMWLDLARYADTMGYEKDSHRDIWPFRDWLIRVLNDDLPLDQFTLRVLAGDLLPDATTDDRLATAFHRNTQTNTEGGTDDEEFRVAAVIDRINTTWQVWQATTFGCCQCHSHPYDPIEHESYYEFMAIFNSTRDCDLNEEWPRLSYPTDRQDHQRAEQLDQQIERTKQTIHQHVLEAISSGRPWHSLRIRNATSTGNTQLEIRPIVSLREAANQSHNVSDGNEVWTAGTPTSGSQFTLEAKLPAGLERLSAIRIDVLLQDREQGQRVPELGFVLSQLRGELLDPETGAATDLTFRFAACDEANPTLDPIDSLHENQNGWGQYTRTWRDHWSIFVLDQEVTVRNGAMLRLRLDQKRTATGDNALLLKRSRYAVTDNQAWTHLTESGGEIDTLRTRLAELQQQRQEIPHISIPILAELPPQSSRKTFVFQRGNWLEKGAAVSPQLPEAFPKPPADMRLDRFAVARWLTSPENPLTARVFVNRIWEQLFGRGIVETVEDFGTSGALPTHPELLDDLALQFQGKMKWSLKSLLRELVLSSTYRQSAKGAPASREADPRNLWLARGPRQRLTAEMIRDQALAISGRLSSKMYGPPVMPPQPGGVWQTVYSGAKWETSPGEDQYRRALYTYWRRTSAYPSMLTFDATSREVCTLRRSPTNTPLQALVTLNDQVYYDAAAALARRMQSESDDNAARIAWAYRLASGEQISVAGKQRLLELLEQASSQSPPDQDSELWGLTITAAAILNLDEVLTR